MGASADASSHAWAVGFSTSVPRRQQVPTLALIEHFDGTLGGLHPVLTWDRFFGLRASSPHDIRAFGSFFADDGSGHQTTLLLHGDGQAGSIAPSPDPTKGGFYPISFLPESRPGRATSGFLEPRMRLRIPELWPTIQLWGSNF